MNIIFSFIIMWEERRDRVVPFWLPYEGILILIDRYAIGAFKSSSGFSCFLLRNATRREPWKTGWTILNGEDSIPFFFFSSSRHTWADKRKIMLPKSNPTGIFNFFVSMHLNVNILPELKFVNVGKCKMMCDHCYLFENDTISCTFYIYFTSI